MRNLRKTMSWNVFKSTIIGTTKICKLFDVIKKTIPSWDMSERVILSLNLH